MRRSASSTRSGEACLAGEPIDLSQLPAGTSASSSSAGFRAAVVEGRLWIAAAGSAAASGPEPSGVLVLKTGAVSSRLDLLDTLGETHLALIANETSGDFAVDPWGLGRLAAGVDSGGRRGEELGRTRPKRPRRLVRVDGAVRASTFRF